MGCRINVMLRHKNSMNFVIIIHQSSSDTKYMINEELYFENKNFLVVDFSDELKILTNTMYCLPAFVPFIQHRWSRFSIVFKEPGTFQSGQ